MASDYLLVLVCVVLTVLLGDGGPADGAHVVHGVSPAHQPRLPAQPRPGPVPVEQHARLLVVVHAGPGIEPGAVTSGVREQTSAQVTCGSAIKRLSQHSGDWSRRPGLIVFLDLLPHRSELQWIFWVLSFYRKF